jgi:two-component system, LytTR family, response regulator
MRVLIVDDEPLAQTALADILSRTPQIKYFDTANDAVEALEKITVQDFDIIILDISMPEVSGFELLDQITAKNRILPAIIFVTAHEQHAIAAFHKHALDYVLKPYTRERMVEALGVAFRRAAGEMAIKVVETLPHLERLTQRRATRIAIKSNGRILFIEPEDIITVKAEGNYVLLQKQAGSYLLRESLSAMEQSLKPHGFIRIHRSMLVNSSCVEEIEPWPTGEYCLRVKGGKEYTVTRTYKKNLRDISTSWIGVDSSFDRFEDKH